MGFFDVLGSLFDDDDFDEDDYMDAAGEFIETAGEVIGDFFAAAADIFDRFWDFLKKIFVRIINFTKNILSFFKDPARMRKLARDKNKIAVAIKEKLEDGNYAVVNCLFDKKTNSIEDTEVDAIGIEGEDMDRETRRRFKKKNMLVLQ